MCQQKAGDNSHPVVQLWYSCTGLLAPLAVVYVKSSHEPAQKARRVLPIKPVPVNVLFNKKVTPRQKQVSKDDLVNL